MRLVGGVFSVLFIVLCSCGDNTGVKGTLTISLTDSPADAANVKSVNLFVTNVDAYSGGEWKSLRHFDQAVGINLLEYTGGKSLPMIDQFLDPGSFSKLRMTLNLADLGSSLIRSPQCNVGQTDGTTKPIFYFEPGTIDMIVEHDFGVASRGHSDITIDFDVRKSLYLDDQGKYIFKPAVRMIETAKAGHIAATVTNHNPADRLVVFAYPAGQYAASEASAPPAGAVRFSNSITSGMISNTKFGIGFLESGNYDLIFVKVSGDGEFISILGRQNGITVTAGQTLSLNVDLTTLSGS